MMEPCWLLIRIKLAPGPPFPDRRLDTITAPCRVVIARKGDKGRGALRWSRPFLTFKMLNLRVCPASKRGLTKIGWRDEAEVLASRMQPTSAHPLILRDCCGIGVL